MRYIPALVAEGFLFPESPRWHGGRGEFLFSDIDRGEIHAWRPGSVSRCVYRHPGWISGLAFAGDGAVLVSAALQRQLYRVPIDDSDRATVFAELGELSEFAVNDLIRTPQGHCFVGSVDFDFAAFARGQAAPKRSRLLHVAADGTSGVASSATNFPNGMAITADGSRLIVADSLDQCLYAFPLHADGILDQPSVFAALPGEMPDGISLDADGAVWVASHHRVLRVREGGDVVDAVDMGTTRATACMLGGVDGRTLLVTASDSHDRDVINANPSGRIFRVEVGSPGVALPSIY